MKCSIYTRILGKRTGGCPKHLGNLSGQTQNHSIMWISFIAIMYLWNCLMFCHILRQTWKALKTNRGGVRNWVLFAVLYGVQYLVWTLDLVWTCNSCICCRNMSYPTILLPDYLRLPSQEMSFSHWSNLISIMLRGQSMIYPWTIAICWFVLGSFQYDAGIRRIFLATQNLWTSVNAGRIDGAFLYWLVGKQRSTHCVLTRPKRLRPFAGHQQR